MFATAVEVARLYRLRIMEFLIANRTRPVALHRTANNRPAHAFEMKRETANCAVRTLHVNPRIEESNSSLQMLGSTRCRSTT
jgi:hypothetical protein